jgi:hypothetical protein
VEWSSAKSINFNPFFHTTLALHRSTKKVRVQTSGVVTYLVSTRPGKGGRIRHAEIQGNVCSGVATHEFQKGKVDQLRVEACGC